MVVLERVAVLITEHELKEHFFVDLKESCHKFIGCPVLDFLFNVLVDEAGLEVKHYLMVSKKRVLLEICYVIKVLVKHSDIPCFD